MKILKQIGLGVAIAIAMIFASRLTWHKQEPLPLPKWYVESLPYQHQNQNRD